MADARNARAPTAWPHFLVGEFIGGAAVGWLALGLLLACDREGLGRLILGDSDGWVAVAVLMLAFAGTFGIAAIGTRIATTDDGVTPPGSGLRHAFAPASRRARTAPSPARRDPPVPGSA